MPDLSTWFRKHFLPKRKTKKSRPTESRNIENVALPEEEYRVWVTKERIFACINSLPNDPWWNVIFGIYVLVLIIHGSWIEIDPPHPHQPSSVRDFFGLLIQQIPYIFHVTTLICNDYHNIVMGESRSPYQYGYILDAVTLISPYIIFATMGMTANSQLLLLVFNALQMHRPFRYLWSLNYYLKASIVGILFKYFYISISIRIFYAFIFFWCGITKDLPYNDVSEESMFNFRTPRLLVRSYYEINKIFIPMGPEQSPGNIRDRIFYIIVTLSGVLLVMGIAIASLSLIISLYMRPEEEFRSRFRLIMEDMKQTNVPLQLRKKVETFYRMFWHKQKAVSETRLLPIFPPCLVSSIRTNIYFKGMQKSRVFRDLPNPFLTEIAKRMETVRYIPGDFVINRNSNKYFMFFINYGDVELLSAEDDETPLLRFTRGTILNPCGPCIEVSCTRSYVAISAATFCIAHVLKATDLWQVAAKYSLNGQSSMIHAAFNNHLCNVKGHFARRIRPSFKYKSNIILLKRALVELKEARDEDGKLLLERADMFINIAGCYVMRNQADMSLTEDSDEICLRPTFPCILQPESSLIFTWNSFVALVTVIVVFVHPYYLVYIKDISVGFRFFNYMVTLIFALDIAVHLSTGTKVEEGVPLTLTQTCTEQVKSPWFVINLASILPMFEFVGVGYYSGINKLIRLPQVFRMLKYLEDLCVYHSNVLRLFAFFLLSVIMTYVTGALQQFFGCVVYGYCLVKNFTNPPYWVYEPLDNGPVEGRLTYSLYSAISMITFTTHKTAKIAKQLMSYQLFVLILMEVCCIVNMLIEGTYSATIMVTENMRDRYMTCINTVKTSLVKINMDPVLRQRFINYLQLCWYTDKAYAITHRKLSILYDLPPHVNEDILTMQRSKYFLCIPFMKFLPNDDLKKISAQARLFYTAPGEILLNTGDICNEICVIKEGVCEVLDPQTKTVMRLLHARGYFGDIDCLLRLPAYYSVRAATHVRIFTISRKRLEACLTTPKIRDAINYAKELPEYTSLLTAQKAFLKYEPPPRTPNRERFPLKRKHESDFEFLHPFYKFGYLSIFRYVFPRFTIRPDGLYLKRYEYFRAACALAAALIYPTYTFLVLQWPFLWKFTWFLDISAYFDIVQRMLVGYFSQNGILIYHPSSTFTHYLRGAFLIDLLGCLPLEGLDYVRTTIFFQDNAYRIPAGYSALMFNRLIQLYRVPHTLDILDDYIDRQDIILMIKAVPVFMALICVVTSLILEASITKWKVVSGGWRLEIIRDPIHGNWIENNGEAALKYNITATPWNAVLTTFYWVVYETTSTGFNLFQPNQLRIMVVLITGMLLGTVITVYYAVRVISIRANVNQALGKYQEHMKDIRMFMKREKLNKKLQRIVISHYENQWERVGGTSYCSILELCDQITLRTDAILHIYGGTFMRCPIIPNIIPLMRNVGRVVKSVYLREKMTIVEWDDVISEMYVVDRGFVKMFNRDEDQVTYLPRGSVFGNLDLQTVVCPTKFVSGSSIHLLKINADEFHDIIQDFPAVKDLMVKHRPNDENYIATDIQTDQLIKLKIQRSEMAGKIHITTKFLKFFHKHPKIIQIYTIIICNLSLYGELYNAGFQCNMPILIIILYLLDVCFILTILLRWALPYMIDKGTDAREELLTIRNKYRKKLFKYESFSCFPIEILSVFSKNPWTAFAFLRLNRCFRLMSINESTTRYHKNLNINLTITTVASVSMWFMLFVHTAACIWFHLSIIEENRKPDSSWRCMLSKNLGSQNQSLSNNYYLYSVYFIITTFAQNGVGDILPQQQSEVVFVCILMIASTIIFMIFVGEFSNIIQYQSFRYYAFYSKYLELLAFLENNKVAINLIEVIKKYTLHLWQESRGRQVPYFLESAPQSLRLRIMSAAYMHHLTSHPVFGKCEPSFLRQLVGHLRLFHYSEDLFVVKEFQITNSMYFVHKGRVQQVDEDTYEEHEIFKPHQYFGSVNGLKRDIPFEISYKTVIKSQVLTLCYDEWEYLLNHFLESRRIVESYDCSTDDNTRPKKSFHIERRSTLISSSAGTSRQNQQFPWPTDNRKSFVEILNEKSKRSENIPMSQLPMEIKHSTAAGSTDPLEKIDNDPATTAIDIIKPIVNDGQPLEIVYATDTKQQDVSQIYKTQTPQSGIKISDSAANIDALVTKPNELQPALESRTTIKTENTDAKHLDLEAKEPTAAKTESEIKEENIVLTETADRDLFSGEVLNDTLRLKQTDIKKSTEPPTDLDLSNTVEQSIGATLITQDETPHDKTLTVEEITTHTKIMHTTSVVEENYTNQSPLDKSTIGKDDGESELSVREKMLTELKTAQSPENLLPTITEEQVEKSERSLLNKENLTKDTKQDISEPPIIKAKTKADDQTLTEKTSEKSYLNESPISSKSPSVTWGAIQIKSTESRAEVKTPEFLPSAASSTAQSEKDKPPRTPSSLIFPDRDSILSVEDYLMAKRQRKIGKRKSSDTSATGNASPTSSASSADDKKKK